MTEEKLAETRKILGKLNGSKKILREMERRKKQAEKKTIAEPNNPINNARKEAGLQIADLARILGMPYRTAQNFCEGRGKITVWQERLILKEIAEFSEGKVKVPEPTPIYMGYFRKSQRQIEEEIYPMIDYYEKFVNNVYVAKDSKTILNAYFVFLKKFFPKQAEILLSTVEDEETEE